MSKLFYLESSNPFLQAYRNMYLEFVEKWPFKTETPEEEALKEQAWKDYMESIL